MTVAAPSRQAWFLDTHVTFRVAGVDGDDGIVVIESWARRGDSPPLHVHHTEDELFHVVDGELTFVHGDRPSSVRAGETLLAPKGIPHTYRVESPTARWLTVTTNGDFEAFVRAASRPAERHELPAPAGPPTDERRQQLAKLAARSGIEFVGPPL
jgi:mannose-6-phosphate isomerase-like protein (cupin superfamily)